ncbi:MAG: ferrous iron transport protein B, partial [Defluviitaleaceae bacterium]|nr:ferrous iron transport protein B [Defluviitaleaceae bacterium]
PGVTVEQKTGVITGRENTSIVDLPGIYSLSPYTSEEIVTRDFLLKARPDAIINIADATNIERNLYLTMQLIELQIPMVLALNMMDEVMANNGSIDIAALQEELGVPVVPISAAKKQGLDELVERAEEAALGRVSPTRIDFCSGAVHRAIHAISHLIEDHALRQSLPVRFAATKLVEGDDPVLAKLSLTQNETEMIEHAVKEMEAELGTDREAAMADMRYAFIGEVCERCVAKARFSREYIRSVRVDSVLTHKIFAIPSFLLIMLAVFFLTFGAVGNRLSALTVYLIGLLAGAADAALTSYGLNPIVRSLFIDGVFSGVGAVLGFVPIVLTLFFLLSLLEDSGYMARVAYVMDKPLRKIGLSGKSFVPLLIGFGCTVPAVMAARTLPGERDKKMTVLLTPFVSCGAKLPIYAMLASVFFPGNQALVMISLYLAGIIFGTLSAFVMKRTLFRGRPVPFVMELPNYRLPSLKSVLALIWDKAKDFLRRAFTVILFATVVVWFLKSFDTRLNYVPDGAGSMLASLGRLVGVVFSPLGFGDWRVSTGLIAGLAAKEAVISTLAVLAGSASELRNLFDPLSAISFLTFTLLYTPCVAAVATARRELGSLKWTLFMVAYQTCFAWAAAFCVHKAGGLVLALFG